MKQLTESVLETALNEELTGHLGHEKHGPAGSEMGNVWNGTRPKTANRKQRRETVSNKLIQPPGSRDRRLLATCGRPAIDHEAPHVIARGITVHRRVLRSAIYVTLPDVQVHDGREAAAI